MSPQLKDNDDMGPSHATHSFHESNEKPHRQATPELSALSQQCKNVHMTTPTNDTAAADDDRTAQDDQERQAVSSQSRSQCPDQSSGGCDATKVMCWDTRRHSMPSMMVHHHQELLDPCLNMLIQLGLHDEIDHELSQDALYDDYLMDDMYDVDATAPAASTRHHVTTKKRYHLRRPFSVPDFGDLEEDEEDSLLFTTTNAYDELDSMVDSLDCARRRMQRHHNSTSILDARGEATTLAEDPVITPTIQREGVLI